MDQRYLDGIFASHVEITDCAECDRDPIYCYNLGSCYYDLQQCRKDPIVQKYFITFVKTYLEESILDDKCRTLKRRDISPKVYEQYYDDFETIGEG